MVYDASCPLMKSTLGIYISPVKKPPNIRLVYTFSYHFSEKFNKNEVIKILIPSPVDFAGETSKRFFHLSKTAALNITQPY